MSDKPREFLVPASWQIYGPKVDGGDTKVVEYAALEEANARIAELEARLSKAVEALKKVSSKKEMTIYSRSEEFMDGAHQAFCDAAEIASEALAEISKEGEA